MADPSTASSPTASSSTADAPTVVALTPIQWAVLRALPESGTPFRSVAVLRAELELSETSCYVAIRQLELVGAIERTKYLSKSGAARWYMVVRRTPFGARIVAGDPTIDVRTRKGGPQPGSPAPSRHGDEVVWLLDPTNDNVAAVTFQTAAKACGIPDADTFRTLPVPQRRRFERAWSHAMRLACAARGTPIADDRPHDPPSTEDSDDDVWSEA